MKRAFTAILLLALLTTGAVVAPSAASPEPVRARHGIVASVSEIAAKVGVAVMQRGCTAVGAPVASALTLAAARSSAGHLGGGGRRMIRPASARRQAMRCRQ